MLLNSELIKRKLDVSHLLNSESAKEQLLKKNSASSESGKPKKPLLQLVPGEWLLQLLILHQSTEM